jgi:WD40 repeat protein
VTVLSLKFTFLINLFQVFYSGYYNGSVGLWNTTDTSLIATKNQTTGAIRTFKWLQDDRLVWGTYNNKIVFWNTTSRRIINSIAYTSELFSLELLSNGCLASGAAESLIQIWNTSTFSLVHTIKTDGIAYFMKQLPNGNMASAGADMNVTIWETNNYTKVFTMSRHTELIIGLELLTDGTLLSASFDCTVNVWNTTSGALLNSFNPDNQALNFIMQLSNEDVAVATNSLTFWQINGTNTPVQVASNLVLPTTFSIYALAMVNCNTLAAGRSDSSIVFIDTFGYTVINIAVGVSNTDNPIFFMVLIGNVISQIGSENASCHIF